MSIEPLHPSPARLVAGLLLALALPGVGCWYSLDPVNNNTNNNDSPPQDASTDASTLDGALPDGALDAAPGDAAVDAGPDAALTCGNGSIDPTEDCDGTRLDGATCESRGYTGGELACDACRFDESGCYTCGGSTGLNCPASSISDDFGDMTVGGIWGASFEEGSATYHETASGFLRFTLAVNEAGSYAGYLTSDRYDLTEDAITLEIRGVPDSNCPEAELSLEVAKTPDTDYAGITVAGGNISAFYWVSGAATTIAQRSYSSLDQYWRISETGGRLYFETSSDGHTWNALGDVANPWAVDGVYLAIQAGTWAACASPGTATVDNFNLVH